MNWKKLLLPSLILCFLATMSFWEVYAISPVDANEAMLFITETVESLESSRQKIETINQTGLMEIDTFKEVSLKEIDTKFNLSRDYLELAIEKFNQGEHSEAKDLAFRARQNAQLASFYLDALLNQPTDIGVDDLTLGGDISHLLDIQEAIRLAQLTWEQFLSPTQTTESADEILVEEDTITPETETADPAIDELSEIGELEAETEVVELGIDESTEDEEFEPLLLEPEIKNSG
jgi:hypothetical protein